MRMVLMVLAPVWATSLLVFVGCAAHPATVDRSTPHTVDLFALAESRTTVVDGAWAFDQPGAAAVSDESKFARLAFPYRPPAEYDYVVEFTRLTGTGDVWQHLSLNGRPLATAVGVGAKNGCWIGRFNGEWGHNPTRVDLGEPLSNGQRHRVVARVRKDRVEVELDGKLVTQWQVRDVELSVPDGYRLPQPGALGLGSYKSPTRFHSARVIELSSERPADAGRNDGR